METPFKEKAKRKPNFSENELQALAEKVLELKPTLMGKFSDIISHHLKNEAWGKVTSAVNDVGTIKRSKEDIKRKWQDWSSAVKKKEIYRRNALKKTGGGQAVPDLNEMEVIVVTILGDTAIEGVHTGIDSTGSQAETTPLKKQKMSSDKEKCLTDEITSGQPETKNFSDLPSIEQEDHGSQSSFELLQEVSSRKKIETPKSSRSTTPTPMNETHQLLIIESERLECEKQRLAIASQRLAFEKQRMDIAAQTLEVEKEKLALIKQKAPAHP